jgi:3-isopropylmalate/(R)-2-methylmalate dehydratase small subunit
MTPFTVLEGAMAVLPQANINTDAIIPSPWLRFANVDLGKGLFGGLRYAEDGSERPDFVLNQPAFRSAKILLADENFGCGSSREAAVWALAQFGIRCVLAPSFADIFYENAFRNGVLAARIDPAVFEALRDSARAQANHGMFRVDLAARTITAPGGISYDIQVPTPRADALIRGQDEIAMTMTLDAEIERYYADARVARPWLYPAAASQGTMP